MDINKAQQTQLDNIAKKTGKTLDELKALVNNSGQEKHGQIVAMLKTDLGLGHGDANAVAHFAKATGGIALAESKSEDQAVDDIYSGNKAALRPIHDAVMEHMGSLGEFEIAPKKGYLSLRRKKQFAMVGPATAKQIEVGLNMKGVPANDRLVELAPGGMCQYKVRLSSADEVDTDLKGWIQTAFDSAG
ncbi:MAG: DUF4287 domain-containing protein [bacterium]